MNKFPIIFLLVYSTWAVAAVEDDCWKMVKPFALDAKVNSVRVVDVSPYKSYGYKSINFHLSKRVPVWETKDWDSMPRDVLSCKYKDGILSHPYGSLADMRSNQKQVNDRRLKEKQDIQNKFK